MSDMLQKAIIDAEALREAATKNAETLVLEKFSSQIKDAVENLLEQDDLGLGLDAPAPEQGAPSQEAPAPEAAASPQPAELSGLAKNIPLAAMSTSDDEIEIPLDQLFEEVDRMTSSFRFAGGDEIMDEDLLEEEYFEEGLMDEDYLEEDYLEEELMDEDYLEEVDIDEELMDEDDAGVAARRARRAAAAKFDKDRRTRAHDMKSVMAARGQSLDPSFFTSMDADEMDDADAELSARGQIYRSDQGPLGLQGQEKMYSGFDQLDEDYELEEDYLEEDLMDEDYLEEDYLEEDYLEEDYLEEELHQGGHAWPHGHPAEEGPLGEGLVVDIQPVKRGWAGMSEGEISLAEEELLAMEYDSKVREEREVMRKKVKELSEANRTVANYNKKLVKATNKSAKFITKLRNGVITLEEKLDQANLLNAKLLYQNKALENDSLNERQKENIVEAVSNAETIEEARVIYETLQNTVGSTSRKTQPNSLSEAVQKSSSVILSSRRESERGQKQDPTLTRWKFLAGIDKQ